MKIKLYALYIAVLLICTYSLKSNATTVIVNVEDFEFNPTTFTINAGDTIKWMWDNGAGYHTTTSTTIPGGATQWDEQINSGSQVFIYIPTIAGSYNYNCSFHFSMGMVGQFTVLGSTAISDVASLTSISFNLSTPISHELQLFYSIPKTTTLSIRLYDIIGNLVETIVSSTQEPGIYSKTFEISGLNKGMHIVTLETQDIRLSRKILIQ